MTDTFRALCAELLDELQGYKVAHPMHCQALLNRARAELEAQPEPVAPTDEEWDTLKERLWDQYETIGYQGERFMYDNDFSTAFDDARAALARYGTPANNTREEI